MSRTLSMLICLAGAAIGFAHAQTPQLEYGLSYGGTSQDAVWDIAVDGNGNLYVAGFFYGSVDFDPGVGTELRTSAGNDDIFVQKFDTSGNILWVAALGSTGRDEATSIASDAAGNVYITGRYGGTVDFDPGPGVATMTASSGRRIFVLKLDTDGNFVWVRQINGSGLNDVGSGIDVDSAGNVYVTGTYSNTADFDPGPGVFNLTGGGVQDSFALKLNSAGDFVWASGWGGTPSNVGNGIAVDASNNVYVAGSFSGTIDFDPGGGVVSRTSSGTFNGYVLKLNSGGGFSWVATLGGGSSASARGVALDSTGNVYSTGNYSGTADFDPGAGTLNLTSNGDSDVFVQKLDSAGALLWARGFGGTSFDIGRRIAVNAAGETMVTGEYHNTVDFDPGPGTVELTSSGGYDAFSLFLDSNGDFEWVSSVGSSMQDIGVGVAFGPGEVFYAASRFRDTVDIDPGAGEQLVTSQGSDDVLIQRFGPPDTTPPNATAIVPDTLGPTNQTSIDFAVTFDEDVQNFDDDVIVSHNGTSNTGVNVSGSGDSYTVTVEDIGGDGSFTLAVSTVSDVQDLAGNLLASSVTSATVSIDNTAPDFSGLSVSPSEASEGQEVILSFASSEDLSGAPDVLVNGNPASASLKSPFAYAYTVSPLDPLGPATIQINGVDLAGNPGQLNDSLSLVVVEAAPGLPVAWPILAALALLIAGAFTLRSQRHRAKPLQK